MARRAAFFAGVLCYGGRRITQTLMEPAEAVLRFLSGVSGSGPGSEAEFYLRLFRSRASESFAAIVVDPDTMRENADGVALDLRLLNTLSLAPIVVLGFYAPSRAQDNSRRLRKKLFDMGIDSELLSAGSPRDAIVSATQRSAVPIVSLDGQDEAARLPELAAMLNSLKTHKLIFLRNEGGLRVEDRPLSVVNLSDEFDSLIARRDLSDAQRSLLDSSRKLVFELVAHELLVTVTSPLSLLHELFTVRGAGTLLRKGARITRHNGFEQVDVASIEALLTSSFGKPPKPELLQRRFTHVYVEERFRGAALVSASPLGAYLSKFAVTREAQGEGVGRDLWQAMTADHRVLFWRAREHNPIRAWYERQCDGRTRVGEWNVYWTGLPKEQIPEAIDFVLSQPIDF
jgi:hypothetical protein